MADIPIQLRYSTNLTATPTTASLGAGPLHIGETAWTVAAGDATKIWIGDHPTVPHNRLLLTTTTVAADTTAATAWYLKGVAGHVIGALTSGQTNFASDELVTKHYVDTQIAAGQTYAGSWDAGNNNPDVLAATKVNGQFWTVDGPGTPPATLPGIAPGTVFNDGDTLTWLDTPAPNGTFLRTSASGMTQDEGDLRYVRLHANSTMDGTLFLTGTQTAATAATTRGYVDGAFFNKLTGDTIAGPTIINHNSTPPTLITTQTELRVIGDNNESTRITIEAYNNNPVLWFRRSSGLASDTGPNHPLNNDNLGAINFQTGWNNAAGTFWARMRAQTTEAWTDDNHGCHITFDVTANGASQPMLLSVLDVTSDGIAVTGRATLTQGPRVTGGDSDVVRKQDVDAAITKISGGTF